MNIAYGQCTIPTVLVSDQLRHTDQSRSHVTSHFDLFVTQQNKKIVYKIAMDMDTLPREQVQSAFGKPGL